MPTNYSPFSSIPGHETGTPTATGTTQQPTTRRKIRRADSEQRRYEGQQRRAARRHGQQTRAAGGNRPSQDDKDAAFIRSLVRLQYGGATRETERQAAQVPHYYDNYRTILTGIQGRQQQAYNAAVQQTQQLGTGLANAAAQASGGQLHGDAAQAAEVRARMLGGFGGLITSQGLTENQYLGNRQATSVADQARSQEQANRSVVDLKREKGAYRAKIRGDLDQQARDLAEERRRNAIALLIAQGNISDDQARLLLDTRSEINDVREGRADRRADAREGRADRRADARADARDDQRERGKERAERRKEKREEARERREIIGRIRLYKGRVTGVGPGDTVSVGGPDFVMPKELHMSRAEITQELLDDGFEMVEIREAWKAWERRRKRRNQGARYTPDDARGQ